MNEQENTEIRVRLNEKEMTQAEFDKKKVELEKKPGVHVVEIGENSYKTRLNG